jgi:hypothetical protein
LIGNRATLNGALAQSDENLIFSQLSTINYQLLTGGIAQLVERLVRNDAPLNILTLSYPILLAQS